MLFLLFQTTQDGFVGLIPLVERYVREVVSDAKTKEAIDRVLRFISGKASGIIGIHLSMHILLLL